MQKTGSLRSINPYNPFLGIWLGTVRGRVGYAFDRVLPYVTGGLAVGDIKANSTLGSVSETL